MSGIDRLTTELGTSLTNIKIVEDFVDSDDLDLLIKYGKYFDFYKKNNCWPEGVVIPSVLHEIVNKYEDRMISFATSLYSREFEKDRYMDFSYRHEGSSVDTHVDNVKSEVPGSREVDSSNKFWSGHLSVICYLNDDFDGGEIYFPEQDFEYVPKTGDVIMFPGNVYYKHEVKKFTKSPRITMSLWTRFKDYNGEDADA